MFDSSRHAITSSRDWVEYFRENANRQREIPWHIGPDAPPDELAEIAASLRAWQLGETSDGSHLLASGNDYAARIGDPDFVDAVRLFIAEEQRHGNNLGRFLDLAGIERAESDWGDTIFRKFRYFVPRMEVWATPVVMVETHALVYYNAIRFATRSRVLKAICGQILADEVAHIRFQCERLAILHRDRSPVALAATNLIHRGMFAGITLAVWVGHRRALRAGGYGFDRYWNRSWRLMGRAWRLMAPGAYEWRPTVATA